jgi:hypothetical protein
VAPHPPAGGRRVAEIAHVGALGERAPHLRAPHALAAAVHDAHLEHAATPALVEVVLDHVHGVARREGVKVELARDGENEGVRGFGVASGVVVRPRHFAPPLAAATK